MGQYLAGGLLAFAAATIGVTAAPVAAADPTSCQTVGMATVCGQGTVTNASESTGSPAAKASPGSGGNCTNAYGNYQRC